VIAIDRPGFGHRLLEIPALGDVVRHAVSPWVARAMWPRMLRKIFGPAPTPAKFSAFTKEMAVRPSQLGASAADSALMVPDAALRSRRYGELKMPVAFVAGEDDRVVDTGSQSGRLHDDITRSTLRRIAGAGHMVHHTATEAVMAAIDEAAERTRDKRPVSAPRAAHPQPQAAT
jgi:pimeloyl-ACP methyl ester carboxylesterase